MTRIEIKPLSVNEAYRGRRFSTAKKNSYTSELMLRLPAKMKIYDKMQINLRFGFKTRASDIDNGVKCLMDILQEKYGFNDNKVYRMILEKEITKVPFVEFEILEYNQSIIDRIKQFARTLRAITK